MKKAAVVFSAAAVMAMTAVSVPTPVEARGGWGWGPVSGKRKALPQSSLHYRIGRSHMGVGGAMNS